MGSQLGRGSPPSGRPRTALQAPGCSAAPRPTSESRASMGKGRAVRKVCGRHPGLKNDIGGACAGLTQGGWGFGQVFHPVGVPWGPQDP